MGATGARRAALALLIVALSLGGARGFEDQEFEGRLLTDRWHVGFGTYLVDFNTAVQIGSGKVLGTFIRLESDLGLDRYRDSLFLDGFYRFRPKKSLAFSYYGFDRSASTVIDERLEIGDEEGNTVVYDVGAAVDTRLASLLFQLTYRYSFINNGRVEAGIGGGLSTYRYDVEFEGEGTVIKNDGEQEELSSAGAGADFIAPIPTIAFFIHYAITPRLIFRTSFNYLDVGIDKYAGQILDSRLVFDYFFSKNVGIGGGMSATDLEVSSDDDVNPWKVEYSYSGFVLYLSLAF
jgi:hypothetical protein